MIPQKNGESKTAKACDECIKGIIEEKRFAVASLQPERFSLEFPRPSLELTDLGKRTSRISGEYTKRTSQSEEYARRMSQVSNSRLSSDSAVSSSSSMSCANEKPGAEQRETGES